MLTAIYIVFRRIRHQTYHLRRVVCLVAFYIGQMHKVIENVSPRHYDSEGSIEIVMWVPL
jgi:hypothetical protein